MKTKCRNYLLIALMIIVVHCPKTANAERGSVFTNNSGDYSTQNITQVYVEQLMVNGNITNEVTSNQLVVHLADDQGGYRAYTKEVAQKYLPQSVMESFSPEILHGYNGTYQYVLFGRYRQELTEEPILWRVLTVRKGVALLLSEYILDTRPFDMNSNEWVGSDIQMWLNSTFYDSAFSALEKAAIVEDPTLGKVLLPSRAELTNPDYGFNRDPHVADSMRSASGSMYAHENGLWVVKNSDYTNYYARTAPNKINVDLITGSGKFALAKITRDNVGIRPIITVRVSDLPFSNGEGTIEYPYQ